MKIFYALLLFTLPLYAAEVTTAYPANYEFVQVTNAGPKVLASGKTLLLAGQTVPVSNFAAHRNGKTPRVHMLFTIAKAGKESSTGRTKLILKSKITVTRSEGVSRLQAPNNPKSFIEGPKTQTTEFSDESWSRAGDPTPIVATFRHDGQHYRLTVMFAPGAGK